MRFALRFSLFLCVGLLLIAPMTLAQYSTGAIEGTVLDTNGAPLPGVTVEAKSPSLQGTRVTVTDNGGRFRLPSLPPGASQDNSPHSRVFRPFRIHRVSRIHS